MDPPLLIAQLTEFSAEGHGEYRVHGPARRLARQVGVTVVDADPDHRWADWLAAGADLLILHGLSPDYAPLAARRRAAGKATLLEASDDYFDPQPWSAYSVGWLDRGRQDQFWHLVAAVDAVQTSTPALAELWRPAARRVVVFGNHLPAVPPLGPRPDRPLTVGWAGSLTHLPDWYAIAPAVAGWVAAHPSARLAVMTDDAARDFVRRPAGRYAFRPPGSLADYEEFLRGLDVAVVPLLPAPFNRGRTDLKFVELAAHGVVGVFAAEGPYPAAVEPGKTGFLYRTTDELLAHLSAIAADADLLAAVRRNAHAAAVARQQPDADADRPAAYRRLLGGTPAGVELPPGLVAEALADGRHLRLPPGEPEKAVKAAGRPGVAPEAALPPVAQVLRQYPDYAPARRAAARIAVRAGLPQQAVEFLEPLLARMADSPGLLTEAAASYLAAGDAATAKGLAVRAVGLNPSYAAAWNLLRRVVETDGRLAERAARNQPRSYHAALAAAAFLAPADRRDRLAELLDRFVPTTHPEERPQLAAAFGGALAELAADPEALDLVRRACELLPESARLADAYAAALFAAGRVAEAAAESERALRLARTARTFQAEYPDPQPAARRWAIAEYARRHAAPEDQRRKSSA
jgi:tetratricopeptide (TPR) repeat protein